VDCSLEKTHDMTWGCKEKLDNPHGFFSNYYGDILGIKNGI